MDTWFCRQARDDICEFNYIAGMRTSLAILLKPAGAAKNHSLVSDPTGVQTLWTQGTKFKICWQAVHGFANTPANNIILKCVIFIAWSTHMVRPPFPPLPFPSLPSPPTFSPYRLVGIQVNGETVNELEVEASSVLGSQAYSEDSYSDMRKWD